MTDAALYFSEWTAPDGTKRRALVERCPECRSDLFREGFGKWGMQTHGEKSPPTGAYTYIGALDERWSRFAANECRCKTEDWLMKIVGEITLADHSPAGVARVTLGDSRLTCSRLWAGESIHHALIAAAHAVLDSQGVPR